MEVVKKETNWKNFLDNKPLMMFIAEESKVASMSEVELKEFYSGIYNCPLFKKDWLKNKMMY